MLAVLATCTVRGRFDDPDMWWHLKLGQIVWATHRVPLTDTFSFTAYGHPTVPQEWLAQLLIFTAYRLGGYSGLMLWLCVAASAILVAGYALCSLYSGNAKVALLGTLAIWLFGTSGFAIRPQVIGYLLLIVELGLLHLGTSRNPRWFFALPPLFALWVNCHGSFFLGLIVALIILFSSRFSFHVGSLKACRWEANRSRTLMLSLLLSVGAVFLNPGGIKVLEYPLNMLFGQAVATASISEWLPLELTSGRGLALVVILGAIVLAVIVQRAELLWHELLLIAFGAWLAASHRRLVFPFGILVAPVLSRAFAESWENYDAKQDRVLPNAALIAASMLVALWSFPNLQNLALQVERSSPVEAVDFVEAHHLPGPMLNDFTYGGYLIWAATDHPVFVDGRADVFEWTGVLKEYGAWATLEADPRSLLDKYDIQFCLLDSTSPMTRVLPLMPEWKLVYSDKVAVVFVRKTGPVSPAPGSAGRPG